MSQNKLSKTSLNNLLLVDLAIKKHLKISVYIASKSWAIATKFMIVIVCLNSLAEVFESLSSNYTLAKIRTKKLQRFNRFKVIHTINISLLIINGPINKFCLAHLAKNWGKWKVTICAEHSNIKILEFKYYLIVWS